MNYDFFYDAATKRFSCQVEGELEALGDFLTTETELCTSPVRFLNEVLENVQQIGHKEFRFKEWLVKIEDDEVECIHNVLLSSTDLTNNLADWSHFARCGKEDLIELVSAWYLFLKSTVE